jgi:Trk K+ transport system NAD-binding subunit
VEGDVSAKSKVIGRKLMDISDLGEFLVLLVCGSESAGLVMPRGDTVVEKGMHVVLIARSGDGNILERFFGRD